MKLRPKTECFRPKMPENTFELNEDSLPTLGDSDPWGKIMVFRKDIGWTVIPLKEVYTYFKHMNYTHWTFTPDTPYD